MSEVQELNHVLRVWITSFKRVSYDYVFILRIYGSHAYQCVKGNVHIDDPAVNCHLTLQFPLSSVFLFI